MTGYTTSMNYLRRRSVVMKASESGQVLLITLILSIPQSDQPIVLSSH